MYSPDKLGDTPVSDKQSEQKIPMFTESDAAGFPSPAEGYCESRLDLNDLCIKHPAATYFVRCTGDSMIEAGVHSGDVLVVDRSLTAKHGDIVIAALNGEFTVKKLETKPALRLVAMNKQYSPIEITEGSEFEIFGVATTVIHSLKNL